MDKVYGKVQLGVAYACIVTGFKGIATARAEYLHGPPRVQLEGVDSVGRPIEAWYDESRLASPHRLNYLNEGADRPENDVGELDNAIERQGGITSHAEKVTRTRDGHPVVQTSPPNPD